MIAADLLRTIKRRRKRARNERRYRGNAVQCPCCTGEFRAFMPRGHRDNATCPRCGSHERHRMLALYFKDHTNLLTAPLEVLHFAPERTITQLLSSNPALRYTTADLDGKKAMHAMDVCDIPRPDNTFDAVLCSHVLEHVPDDRKAMREILRVLKPGGFAILLVPLYRELTQTYEDPTITSPEARHQAFGQHDHVRKYGMDYHLRLADAGFIVTALPFVANLPDNLIQRHGLLPHDTIERGDKPIPTPTGTPQ